VSRPTPQLADLLAQVPSTLRNDLVTAYVENNERRSRHGFERHVIPQAFNPLD
jgi:hypothetical protein